MAGGGVMPFVHPTKQTHRRDFPADLASLEMVTVSPASADGAVGAVNPKGML